MAGIQMFDLGPPRVDTFSMISNLGKSFFDAADAQRKRAAMDRKWKAEDEADKLNADYAKALQSSLGTDTPAAPSRSISEVGRTTPTPSPRPPSFTQTGGQMSNVNTSGFTPELSSLLAEFKSTFPEVRITSGYRDPSYNAKVGGASGSQHIHGKAFDFSVRDLPEERQIEIANWLRSKGAQGFGYYPNSRSMHADLAGARAWGPDYTRNSLGQTPKWFQQFAGNPNPVAPPSGPPLVAGRSMVAYAGVPRTQVASASHGMGYAPDTQPAAPVPQPVPFEQAIPGAAQFASLGGVGGAPTMPAPQMAAPAPQPAPQAAPAAPPPPAPVQMAQAAPAAPVASDASDPILGVLRRLPPAQQQWYLRALSNRITAPAAMQRLQSMVRQDTWSTTTAPNGQMIQTNPRGEVRAVPGFDKPQDRWTYQNAPNGDLIGTNTANGKMEVLNAGERDATIRQYQFAQRQGFQGSIFDFKRQLAEAGSTKINNVNNGQPAGETEAEKELGKAAGKRYAGFIEAGDQAQAMISDIGNLREISKRVGQQGAAADVKLALGPYAQALGIDITNLNDLQAADAIIKKIAPQLRAPGSGSTSDIEYKGFLASLGNMSTDPRAREVIYDTFEAVARHNVMRGEIAAAYAAKEITRQEADKRIKELGDPMSAFREWRKQNPEKALGNDKRVELPKGVTAEQAVFEARRAVRQGADKKAVADRLKAWGIDPKRLDD